MIEAISFFFPRIVDILLENSANPKIKDINSRTPLHYAAKYCDGCPHVVELLLKRYNYKHSHTSCCCLRYSCVMSIVLHVVFLEYFTSL